MSSQGGAIKAGRAFVELFVEDNKLYRGLDLAASKFKGWGAQIKSMGASLAAGGGAILGPLLTSLKSAVDRGNLFGLLSANTGQAVSELSGMADMAERAGVSVDRFAASIQALEVRTREQADANAYLFTNLQSLGTALDFSKLTAAEKMERIAEAARRTHDPIQQLRIATQAYGDEVGQSLLPILRGGAEAVRRWREENAMTAEQAAQSVAVTKAVNSVWKDLRDTARELGYSLLPTADGIAQMSGELKAGLVQVRSWIKENRAAVVTVAAVGLGLTVAGIAAVGLGTTVAAVGGGIALTLAGIKAALGLLLSPLGLATVAVGGLFYVVATQTEAGRSAVAGLRDDLAAFAGRARESFAGISDALGAGDWSLAWQIGLAAMKAEWANFTLYLQLGWNVTKSLFVDTWKDAVAGLKLLFIDLGAFVGRQLAAISRAILGQLAAVVGAVDRGLGARLRSAQAGIQTDAQINADRDAAKGRILADRQREQSEANEYRDRVAREADQAREDARAELRRLNELARHRARWAELSSYEDFEGGDGESPAPRFHGPTRLADVVKGGFGSHAAIGQQLGLGDSIPQQQLDATRGVMANTSQIPLMARDLNQLARGGRLGP